MTLSIEIISEKDFKRIYETKSEWFIKTLLESVYEECAYDGSPCLKDFKPEGVWFVLITENNHAAGIINLSQINNVMWNCHVIIYEEYRGRGSEEWAIMVADYMKEKYGATKFLAITPYEAAKNYAERAGFKLVGTLSRSVLKNNELLDQYLLEL